MKAKRGAKRSRLTVVAIVIGVVAISLGLLAGVDYIVKNWAGYVWDKESAENFLIIPLPADANDVEISGHRGRGGKLAITFEASTESVDAFVSQFCEGTLYQGYDPFNAIDTRIHHEGAYFLIVDYPTSYYSYSLNTAEQLFGTRCASILGFTKGNGKGQIQILVDKTSPVVALVKLEAKFNCYICNAPQLTPVHPK